MAKRSGPKKHNSGYNVWVGGDKKWFRSLEKAYSYYSRKVRQLGDSVVSLNHAGSGSAVSGAELRGKPDYQGNPGGVKLPRTGHTGFLKAKAVDIITRGGRVVEVRVKR